MPQYRKGRDLRKSATPGSPESPKSPKVTGKLRIVGGRFRGRQINYSGDPLTRPMKDDVREAVFNLVGGWVQDKAVFDLFAGTGAMGLEAISRGASKAFFIERHFPSAKIIRENICLLDPGMNAVVAAADTFFWARRFLNDSDCWPDSSWLAFFCPPYGLYVSEQGKVVDLITQFVLAAPEGSLIVVESDRRFDLEMLPEHQNWVVRQYTPAVISVLKKF